MDLFSKIEKLSEKYIEGFFKNKFSGQIQPVEIARHLAREMRDKKTISLSKVYVPNLYQIYIGEQDWETISVFVASLVQEMQEFIVKKAREKKYSLISPPVVEFLLDKTLTKGNFQTDSKFTGEPPVEPMEDTLVSKGKKILPKDYVNLLDKTVLAKMPEAIKAQLIVESGEDKGLTFALLDKTNIIGRQESADIVLKDTNVSRKHAKIDIVLGQFFITDLDSTNGTLVNEVKINDKQLQPGDRIKLGTTLLEFRVV